MATPVVLAKTGTTAGLAIVALLAVFAYAGATASFAFTAPLAMLADAGTTACLAFLLPLTVGAPFVLPYVPLDWVRRRGFRRCRRCWGCLFHDVNGSGSKW